METFAVHLDHLQASLLEGVDQLGFTFFDFGAGPGSRFLHHLGEHLLLCGAEGAPDMGGDHGDQAIHDMASQHDGFLYLEEFFGFNGGERVFLGIHRAVLQGQIHLGKRDRRGVGAAGLPSDGIGWCVRHAYLQAFDVRTLAEGFLGAGVASTVVGVGGDLYARFISEFVDHFLEQRAFGIG